MGLQTRAEDTIPARTPGQLPALPTRLRAESFHTAVWTGSEMIVWGGATCKSCTVEYWWPIQPQHELVDSHEHWQRARCPIGSHGSLDRKQHDRLGRRHASLNTGGRYYPDIDLWVATSTTNAPPSQFAYTAVWTGSEMIVWGGDGGSLSAGGRYCVPSGIPSPTPAPTPCPGGYAVCNANDSGPGSLRQAILDASSGDTINFAPSVTTVTLVSGGSW